MKLVHLLAFAIISITTAVKAHPDNENTAVIALPQIYPLRSEKITVSIDAQNTTSNQFEIWFCTDDKARRFARDFMIGFDSDAVIYARRNPATTRPMPGSLTGKNFSCTLSYRTSTLRPGAMTTILLNNAPLAGNAAIAFSRTIPLSWRSIKIVSRGETSPMPAVSIKREKFGFHIKITFNHHPSHLNAASITSAET